MKNQRVIKFRAWEKNKSLGIFNVTHCGEVFEHPKAILEQFTSLKDKNGKEIYEGDILHDLELDKEDAGPAMVVIFKKGEFSLQDVLVKDWTQKIREYMTIVGNIHQNPELLKS